MPQELHRLGGYQLLQQIGEGGMAEVFRAEVAGPNDAGLSGTVVIKRIRPELHSQPEFPIFRQMFLNEARLVTRLNHPNLARVFALNEVPDPRTGTVVPFIVGEYVQGRELWALLRVATRGFAGVGVPPGIAAFVAREMARGLGHAHAHCDPVTGKPAPIIHRDVSPENVMISDDGEVKVIDFGVAKALGGFGPQTRTGIIKGKLAYMAPEQVAQRPVPATDVFGAGIVLYEMLTGRRLFGGQNEFLVVQRVLKAQIPPPSSRVPVPRELDEIVMRALDRDLNRRYKDGNALADALAQALAEVPALQGSDHKALLGWVHHVEGTAAPVPPGRERGSDLHLDVDDTIRAVEELKSGALPKVSDTPDEEFGAPGHIDPSVHVAITQAMRTLTPEMVARELGSQELRQVQAEAAQQLRGEPSVEVDPISPSGVTTPSGPSHRTAPLGPGSNPSGRFGSDREVTAYLTQPAAPTMPVWAKLVIALLAAVVLVLLGLLLGLSRGP